MTFSRKIILVLLTVNYVVSKTNLQMQDCRYRLILFHKQINVM